MHRCERASGSEKKKKLHDVVLHMFVSYQNTRNAVSNQDVFWWGSGLCLAHYYHGSRAMSIPGIAIPLPPSRENRRCVYCDENLFRRRARKCSGCGCVTYCDPTCQHNDWKHHKFQCVYWRARKWHRRLLLDGTPLPENHVRHIVSYAFAPPLRARAIFCVAGQGNGAANDPGQACSSSS